MKHSKTVINTFDDFWFRLCKEYPEEAQRKLDRADELEMKRLMKIQDHDNN